MKSDTNIKNQPGAPVEIKPVSFRAGRGHYPRKSHPWLKWFLGVFLAIVLFLLVASAWFVFTARQVVIRIEPQPDEIEIEGGIATPRIGTYYLIRPGEYMLRAVSQCFNPLNERFVVGNEKSQELKFSMTKLPGRLSVQVHRLDKPDEILEGARVFIDGSEVRGTSDAEVEVVPGSHILEIRAEKYQNRQNEIEVEGCGVLQDFKFALLPGWSDITIDSIPGNATVAVDGKPAGKTPLTLELFAGEHDIELKAERYKPWHTSLVVAANQPQVLETVRLQPADGTLKVRTNPSGANVVLSNAFAGRTPLSLTLSADITHRIQLSKAGYETENRKVSVVSAAEKTLIVKLKPRLGNIQLVMAPADAEVVVDGKAMGRVTRSLSLIAVEHLLEIRKKGYQPYRTRITPRPGFTQEIRVTLTREATEGQVTTDIITAKNGYELKLIRPRPFTMGSSRREQGRRSNETLRSVRLQRPFYMGLREVTNKEFREFFAGHNSGAFKGHSLNLDALPVVEVSWEQAARFCNWLSIKESLPPVYIEKAGRLVAANPVGIGYRLPTEAEWEYCARFDKSGSALKYPWGNKFPPVGKAGNFADISAKDLLTTYLQSYNDGYAVTAPPQKFPQSALGLFDLGGNTAEWTHDFYTIYPYSANKIYTDPQGPDDGRHHVVRGAGWKQSSISELRLSYRDYSSTERPDLGFRVCRYLK